MSQKSKPVNPKFKAYINRLASYFRATVFAGEYSMEVLFEQPANEGATASIRVDEVYLNLTVRVGPQVYQLWKNKQYHTVANIICHEFCHILTEPLYAHGLPAFTEATRKFWEEIRERQTERICISILDLVPSSVWETGV